MGRSIKLHGKKVALHTAAAALPAPALATDGGSTITWRQGGKSPRGVALAIDASGGAVTIQDAVLCVYDPDPDAGVPMWRQAAVLNNGDDIVITATLGWEDIFLDVAVNSRLAVYSPSVSANTVTITAKPVEINR